MCLIFTKVYEIDVHFGPYRYYFGGSQIHKKVFAYACVHVQYCKCTCAQGIKHDKVSYTSKQIRIHYTTFASESMFKQLILLEHDDTIEGVCLVCVTTV